MKRTPESEAFIEGGWQMHLAKGNKPWPNDTKPGRYRLDTIGVGTLDGFGLQLFLDPCVSYKDFICSLSTEFEKRYGRDAVPNPLAITIIIRTADGKTMITVRNQKTDYKPGGWHASIGGFMEIKRGETPTEAGLRELKEEAGIEASELTELVCLGVVYNPWTFHTDLVYSALTSLTSAQILERPHDDENEIIFIETSADEYERLIADTMHANVVIAMAAMVMLGSEIFNDDEWTDRIYSLLDVGSRDYDSLTERQRLEKHDTEIFAKMLADYWTDSVAA